ncbi:MAG: shikimate dehydrogenase [Chloroflexi bacterium]|nr:shikimate dehydrogenase [Chloroflexota bacterium]
MLEDTFAFIIHPITIKKDVARKFPLAAKIFTEPQINFLSRFFPPLYISEVTGIQSAATGKELRGWLLACPFTPPTMMSVPVEVAYNKIVACGKMAEKLGAKMLGLGAYTSVVGDGGKTIADRLDIAVTNGDSYTVTMAVAALREAARVMDIDMRKATVAVVGATGTIGSTCAQMLAGESARLMLVGRRLDALQRVRERCEGRGAQLRVSVNLDDIYDADLILTVTSALDSVIEPRHLKPGVVVCDVARPRDVSWRVAQERDDVLVIEGGMVAVPGANADFHFDFGFPPKKAFACMAETMALALEGRYEDYTIGKDIEITQALEIDEIATRHGFHLAGFRTFEKPVTDEQIARVRQKAADNRKVWKPERA